VQRAESSHTHISLVEGLLKLFVSRAGIWSPRRAWRAIVLFEAMQDFAPLLRKPPADLLVMLQIDED
jgi:hypothetical protein